MKKLLKITLTLFITLIIVLGFALPIVKAQWQQQTLPVSGQIRDLAFLNKDTGFAALNNTDVLLRTTNGGTNWNTVNTFRIQTLCVGDNNTLFGIAVNGSKMYRSFNGGTTFDSVGAPGGGYCSFYFVNKDTGWSSGLTGIFMTTNGGNSFSMVSTEANCGSIMFFARQKYNNEYYGFHIDNGLFKTTNSGVNWVNVTGITVNAINTFFLNKDTGWVTDFQSILYTQNGGINWITQYNAGVSLYKVYFINSMKGWCGKSTGGVFNILATTNGGINWGTQTTPVVTPGGLWFIDSLQGWAYNGFTINNLIKTTNGGGNITSIPVTPIGINVPSFYQLKQNYPNPFNPVTTIEFSIPKRTYIQIIIFDILGRNIETVIDEQLIAGTYKISWNAEKFTSGIYYYKLIADNFTETKKMVLIK